MVKTDMTDMGSLLHRRERIEQRLLVDAVANEVINREVPYPHAGEVLEEMSALAGIDPEIAQARLNNHLSSRDVRPLDRNA